MHSYEELYTIYEETLKARLYKYVFSRRLKTDTLSEAQLSAWVPSHSTLYMPIIKSTGNQCREAKTGVIWCNNYSILH